MQALLVQTLVPVSHTVVGSEPILSQDAVVHRTNVLRKLGHIDANGLVQLKGKAACEVRGRLGGSGSLPVCRPETSCGPTYLSKAAQTYLRDSTHASEAASSEAVCEGFVPRCLQLDTADELVATELMFNGVYNSLDRHQLVALASCLVPSDKSEVSVHHRCTW